MNNCVAIMAGVKFWMLVLTVYTFGFWMFFAIIVETSRTDFKVKRYELCNKTQGLIKFKGNITSEGKNQFMTFDLVSPVPLDDNIGLICLIETKTIGNMYTELFVIREKCFCKAAHTFMGEFWYDIERAARHPPGYCPIAAGRYYAHHLQLDFTKITLQTFPFGTLRFTIKLIDNKNVKTHVVCWLIEVDNLPN